MATHASAPNLDWPEGLAACDGDDVVSRVIDLFREACGVDPLAPGTLLVLAPDPPHSADPEEAIRSETRELLQHTSARAEDLDLARTTWGNRGVAYRSSSPTQFRALIAVFLAMGSTTLRILIAPKASDSADSEIAQMLVSFGENVPGPYAGLLFDMGALVALDRATTADPGAK